MDILFVEPNASKTYQKLSNDFAAIETPTWNLLLAGASRAFGLDVGILDCNAMRHSPEQASQVVNDLNPKIVLVSCYGQNPNSSTPFFGSGISFVRELKKIFINPIGFVGPHVAALPVQVLNKHKEIDFVLCNEGIFQLENLFKESLNFSKVKGIAYRDGAEVFLNPPEQIVDQENLENIYKSYAWDLLPYDKQPLDLYRSHLWHADFGNLPRTPFAAIYTSLGCTFKCSFCMINMINRNSNEGPMTASNFNKMRFFSSKWLEKEFDQLKSFGVKTLRISDEMFYLNRAHYKPILDLLTEKKYDFNMWAYSRVDTVRPDFLSEFKKAGINWLCLGIEAGNDEVRSGAYKGKFVSDKVRNTVKLVRDSGIKVLANFIIGLPTDDEESVNTTYKMALDLEAEYSNFYPCMALPGTDLYLEAKKNGIELPDAYSGYAFLSYDCIPNPTVSLTSKDVLRLRDKVFNDYVADKNFKSQFKTNFGDIGFANLEKLTSIKLKRRLLEVS